MGYVLFFAATMLMVVFSPIAVIYNSFRSLFHSGNRLHYLAILIDQMGNVLFGSLFNDILIQKNGYQFGHYQHTISYVLGKNKQKNTLRYFGRKLADLLNWIDPMHVEKAARH